MGRAGEGQFLLKQLQKGARREEEGQGRVLSSEGWGLSSEGGSDSQSQRSHEQLRNLLKIWRGGGYTVKLGFEANCAREFIRKFNKIFVTHSLCGSQSTLFGVP